MDTTTFVGISAFLAVILTIVNLYNLTVRKPQEVHENNLKETERALNEFMKTYSGQYSELKNRVETLEEDNAQLKMTQDKIHIELTLTTAAIKALRKVHDHVHGNGGE